MIKIVKSLTLLCLIVNQLSAIDLKISASNKTLNAPSRYAEKITVIKLSDTMQMVSTKTDVALPFMINNLPAMENAPYMVQITHNGVNYNKVIPPNTPGNLIDINIDVYDTTNTFSQDINLEKFIEIYYYKDVLATDITHHFTNTGRYTFTERGSRNGILMYIPKEGKNLEALATIETMHGQSDIKTLKLNPQPLPDRPEYYVLEQPVKPGEKYYQARLNYRYDGKPLEITFENIYPMTTKPMIILHSKNMTVTWKENPAWDTKAVFNDNIGAEIITLPNKPGKFTLIFTGGIPEQGEGSNMQKGNQSIGASSPISMYTKIGGLAAFIISLLAFFYYIKGRPVWLQMIQAKNKSRIAFELQHLKSLNLTPEVMQKKEKILNEKMEAMDKLIKL
ncbi:MAG: hypothetical protein OEV78_05540 [Spirochaetia bacterium]|nr:hypothetical protein [Spirochaetia bacterium]